MVKWILYAVLQFCVGGLIVHGQTFSLIDNGHQGPIVGLTVVVWDGVEKETLQTDRLGRFTPSLEPEILWLDGPDHIVRILKGPFGPPYLIGLNPDSSRDADHDGLSDLEEVAFGTDPARPDTDGDHLLDGWEVKNVNEEFLCFYGADPLRKDVFVELDWMFDSQHDMRPYPWAIEEAISTYAVGETLPNPDGSVGINLHIDYGQPGAGGGGAEVPYLDRFPIETEVLSVWRDRYLTPARRQIYYWGLIVDRYESDRVGGYAMTAPTSTFTIKKRTAVPAFEDVLGPVSMLTSLVHELGHCLGLLHGGVDSINYKPNYVSNMNYLFSSLSWHYSNSQWIDLDEYDLDESVGVGLGFHVDWNRNRLIDPGPVREDINYNWLTGERDGHFSILRGHDDWENLNFQMPAIDEGTPRVCEVDVNNLVELGRNLKLRGLKTVHEHMTGPERAILDEVVRDLTSGTWQEVVRVPGDYPTLQAAIDEASGMSIIEIEPGRYLENLVIPTGKSLKLRGRGQPEETILDGRGDRVLYTEGASLVLENLLIQNGTGTYGGALYAKEAESLVVRNTIFRHNTSTQSGGAIYTIHRGTVLIDSCVFYENEAGDLGAAFCLSGGQAKAATIQNSLFFANRCTQAKDAAAAVYLFATDKVCFVNNTLAKNDCAGLRLYRTQPDQEFHISNLIFYENTGTAISASETYEPVTIDHSCLYGNGRDTPAGNASAGRGVIYRDPHFANPAQRDFSLTAPSPCLDAGHGNRAPTLDFDGHGRIDTPVPNRGTGQPDYVDMGYRERQE